MNRPQKRTGNPGENEIVMAFTLSYLEELIKHGYVDGPIALTDEGRVAVAKWRREGLEPPFWKVTKVLDVMIATGQISVVHHGLS